MWKEKLLVSTLLLTVELICLYKSISIPKAFIGIFFFFFFEQAKGKSIAVETTRHLPSMD